MSIRIFCDEMDFKLKNWKKVKKLAEKVISDEKKISGNLNFIITNNNNILKLNKQFLKHDYFTDVITFNYNKGKCINGEIYISIDTVKENANNYDVSLKDELLRVMLHGVLHLCGYNDNNESEKESIKRMENYYLINFKGMK